MVVPDDLLVRPPRSLVEPLQATTLDERFDRSETRGQPNGSRLLYGLGERAGSESEERRAGMGAELALATEVQSQSSGRVEVKG